MASSRACLDYVLEQLSELDGVSFRPMMGEYVLYYQGKTIGGVYDDRFLLKPTKTALRLAEETAGEARSDIPYPGAKAMLVADVDNAALCCRMIRGIAEDLNEAKGRKAKHDEQI